MKCEHDKLEISRWLSGEMNETERSAFVQQLASCTSCREALDMEQQLWNSLGDLETPEPSSSARPRFYAMLDTYKATQEEQGSIFSGIALRFLNLWNARPVFRFAYSIVLVAAGLGLGFLFSHSRTGESREEIASLSGQVKEMKEMMMLSLLENPSASERIRGVSYTEEMGEPNKQVVDALLSTLNNDPNVNVRLMTLEALKPIAARNARAREGLVKSIVQQESPLVQAALADVMLALQEKRSVESFKKLLQQKELNEQIRVKINQTITELI